MPDAGRSSAVSWRNRAAAAVYDTAVEALVWIVLVPWALIAIARGRASWSDLRQWLALDPGEDAARLTPGPDRGSQEATHVIVHAVSAGEATAAVAVIDALLRERPSWTVLMTVGNRDARDVAVAARARMPAIAAVVRLPWDRRRALNRWLARSQAAAVAIVEPEFWPGLYRACGDAGVPLLLVNARVYPRDVPRYRLIRGFMQSALSHVSWIGAQSEDARDALAAIGAPSDFIHVAGNVKFDRATHVADDRIARAVDEGRRGGRLTIVAGSTHRADEDGLFAALAALRLRYLGLRLVLAPRHVSRSADILAAATARGYEAVAASRLDPAVVDWDILVLDRLGHLASVYAAGDIAFVGGTLGDHGGHNVAEPAHSGCPIVVGPAVSHVRDIVTRLAAQDAIVWLPDASERALIDAFDGLLADNDARRAMGQRARAVCESEAGAARQSAAAVIEAVEAGAAAKALSARGRRPDATATWPLGASEAK